MSKLHETFSCRKGKTRCLLESAALEELSSDKFEETYNALLEQAADYVTCDFGTLASVNSHADRFDLFYTCLCLPNDSELPQNPWDITKSVQLAKVLGKYLIWLLEQAQPINDSGMILASTVHMWGQHIMFLGAYNILSPNSRQTGCDSAVAHGHLPDKSGSLWNLIIKSWVPLMIQEFNLPKKGSIQQFWGPDELTLLIRTIDLDIVGQVIPTLCLLNMKAILTFRARKVDVMDELT
ncbi:hypothetical protein CcaverHIS002_0500050 [Cutaneotrichosporon cavernicola]|uniref:Uncharacterized protein n=1 Tax=Cutaneotrichosporon cavernicola TaxID=279322 RepID=A0AA48L7K2_9TREE|nr:uncharacterized protein CcaverHIS019_0600050 [Cutaneotrichosporon cavernicola]BEI84604.1 hypothetical protein CcaverHIS002_0500050 [Cutaneotrichosporon cavernicola]BEI93546.1 hypothetical protein CcaverHIS019_0600050 [Cutaneotrichosporon cavernicola]BEJ01323.1 hypothetical protein CcaverHIS631_0600050 [Cutaneotrichosporon cavernicola]BEJ09090.1 hypothetical protein CcaverHIS641_0600050 [Cutaneotrichosporon cavernicola]